MTETMTRRWDARATHLRKQDGKDHGEQEAEGARRSDANFLTVIKIFVKTVLIGHEYSSFSTKTLPAMTGKIKGIDRPAGEILPRKNRPCRRDPRGGSVNYGNIRKALASLLNRELRRLLVAQVETSMILAIATSF